MPRFSCKAGHAAARPRQGICLWSQLPTRQRSAVACRLKKAMGIIHKCRRQGSGSASPKGRARALAPSQSYRFVNNSNGLFSSLGRRPTFSPEISPILSEGGRAPGTRKSTAIGLRELPERSSRGSNRVTPSSFCSTDLRKLPGLISNSCMSPEASAPASSPLQAGDKP